MVERCKGKVGGGKLDCNEVLQKCKKCGNVVCTQNTKTGSSGNKCTNQGFEGVRCLKCGEYLQAEIYHPEKR